VNRFFVTLPAVDVDLLRELAVSRPLKSSPVSRRSDLDVVDDVDRDANDVRLDAALVAASSDTEVAAFTPPLTPRVGA